MEECSAGGEVFKRGGSRAELAAGEEGHTGVSESGVGLCGGEKGLIILVGTWRATSLC